MTQLCHASWDRPWGPGSRSPCCQGGFLSEQPIPRVLQGMGGLCWGLPAVAEGIGSWIVNCSGYRRAGGNAKEEMPRIRQWELISLQQEHQCRGALGGGGIWIGFLQTTV